MVLANVATLQSGFSNDFAMCFENPHVRVSLDENIAKRNKP